MEQIEFKPGDEILTMGVRDGYDFKDPSTAYVAKVGTTWLDVRYFAGECSVDEARVTKKSCVLVKRPKEPFIPEVTLF